MADDYAVREQELERQHAERMGVPVEEYAGYDSGERDDDDGRCPTCHGECWVIVGTDIDCDDGVNGPYDGETIRCPNCRGSGRAKDCWYW